MSNKKRKETKKNKNDINPTKKLNINKIIELILTIILCITLYNIFNRPVNSFITTKSFTIENTNIYVSVPDGFYLTKKADDTSYEEKYLITCEEKNMQIILSVDDDTLSKWYDSSFDKFKEYKSYSYDIEDININSLSGFRYYNRNNNSEDIYLSTDSGMFVINIMYINRFQINESSHDLYENSQVYDIVNSIKVIDKKTKAN